MSEIGVNALVPAGGTGGLAIGDCPVPGGLGTVESGLIGALAIYGIPLTTATAATLACRAIALGVPVLFGGLAALTLAHTVRRSGTGKDAASAPL